VLVQALVDEDRLLSKLEVFEDQLTVYAKVFEFFILLILGSISPEMFEIVSI